MPSWFLILLNPAIYKEIMEAYKKITVKNFKPFYGVFGDANFLKDRVIKHFKNQFLNQAGGDLNFEVFDSDQVDARKIIDSAKAVPMLAKARFIEVRNTDSFKTAELNKFVEFFKKPVTTTCLLFIGIKAPKNKKFFKLLNKEKRLFEYSLSNRRSQKSIIKQECKSHGFQINKEAVEMFVNFVGDQDFGLALDKLFLFKGENKKIDSPDIIESIGTQGEAQIFKFVDNFFVGKLPDVLAEAKNLLDNNTSPILIINLLARQLRFILYFKSSKGKMHPAAPGWLGGKFRRENLQRKFTYQKLYHGHSLFYDADKTLKTTSTEDALVLENIIFDWFFN